MRERWRRLETMIARLRAGEGAHVLADLGESAERWLRSEHPLVPASLRTPLEQMAEVVGDLARALRPAPTDAPPPAERAGETFESEEPLGRYESQPVPAREAPRPEPARAPQPIAPKSSERGAQAKKPAPEKSAPKPKEPKKPAARATKANGAKKAQGAKSKSKKPQAAKTGPKRADGAKAAPKKTAPKKPAAKKSSKADAGARKPQEARTTPSTSTQPRAQEQRRVSARRSTTGKRLRTGVVSDYPTPKKSNGKGREHRPAARRSRRDETDEPT